MSTQPLSTIPSVAPVAPRRPPLSPRTPQKLIVPKHFKCPLSGNLLATPVAVRCDAKTDRVFHESLFANIFQEIHPGQCPNCKKEKTGFEEAAAHSFEVITIHSEDRFLENLKLFITTNKAFLKVENTTAFQIQAFLKYYAYLTLNDDKYPKENFPKIAEFKKEIFEDLESYFSDYKEFFIYQNAWAFLIDKMKKIDPTKEETLQLSLLDLAISIAPKIKATRVIEIIDLALTFRPLPLKKQQLIARIALNTLATKDLVNHLFNLFDKALAAKNLEQAKIILNICIGILEKLSTDKIDRKSHRELVNQANNRSKQLKFAKAERNIDYFEKAFQDNDFVECINLLKVFEEDLKKINLTLATESEKKVLKTKLRNAALKLFFHYLTPKKDFNINLEDAISLIENFWPLFKVETSFKAIPQEVIKIVLTEKSLSTFYIFYRAFPGLLALMENPADKTIK